MFRYIYHTVITAIVLLQFVSCDEGRIYNDDMVQTEEGGTARFTGKISGSATWSQGYTLALAGFEDGNDYALISKNIEIAATDGKYDITLSGIPGEVNVIELCALDRLRRRVATFLSSEYPPQAGILQMSSDGVDMSMAAAIQTEIFNTTCIQCHGGNGHAAAGLDLLTGNSFSNLISIPARKIPGIYRVSPGQSGNSELFLILSSGLSSDWNYDHSVEVVRQEKLDLIRNWIDNL